jgi:hypothetical protein
MNYLKIYCNLIRKAENRTPPEGYTEKHHIFPVSIYGENNRIAVLTAREHYIAHALLEKICIKRYGVRNKKTIKMTCAFFFMGNCSKHYNSHLYEQVKKRHIENMKNTMKGENNPVYGKKLWNDGCGNAKFSIECPGPNWVLGESKEHKDKKSKITKGKKWWNDGFGNAKFCVECPGPNWVAGATEENKRKIGKSNKGKHKGLKWWNDGQGNHTRSIDCPGPNWILGIDEEYKQKLSEANKGLKWWNDGCGNTKLAKECPGEGWYLGRGKFK